ncbi:hypothetical protein TRIP_B50147 [uncultured Desulfatiglans sp.]|uniref:Uncharacterized protein n=1 Tax=Uncultured Desulfatiglans sp. TaxID=1748965 RepID=A0A653AGP4_UNCDX|nr:hypothetical protein TRIP_B50147 [uncultured Desulfatiglans sp.]
MIFLILAKNPHFRIGNRVLLEMVFLANLGVNLHVCLCGDLQVASAQTLDFLDIGPHRAPRVPAPCGNGYRARIWPVAGSDPKRGLHDLLQKPAAPVAIHRQETSRTCSVIVIIFP